MHECRIDLLVIFITGHSDLSLGVQAMKAGPVDFLKKPVDLETLLGAPCA